MLTLVEAVTLESQEQELVRGERCRRLQFDVDLRVSDTKLEGRQVAGMSQRVAGDVWIDDEDRVRRAEPLWPAPNALYSRPRWRIARLRHSEPSPDIEHPARGDSVGVWLGSPA